MSLQLPNAADVRRTLNLLAADCARVAFKRRDPGATDAEALAWGVEHRTRFLDQAVEVMALIALAEAKDEEGQAHP